MRTPAPRFCSVEDGVKALARADVLAARPSRFCAMCNAGDEELADIYAAEWRRMMGLTFRRVGGIILYAEAA